MAANDESRRDHAKAPLNNKLKAVREELRQLDERQRALLRQRIGLLYSKHASEPMAHETDGLARDDRWRKPES